MELIHRSSGAYSPALLLSDQLRAQNYPLVELPKRPDNLHVWYSSNEQSETGDPAREAYEEAIELFKRELSPEECEEIWTGKKSTILDVRCAIQDACKEYGKTSKRSKVGEWLKRCSARIIYYENIMDVMIQGCPSYASLAWGALKFLFKVILNHEELLLETSKAVSRIADVLPRVELLSILYPTERMRFALSELYAKIIQFIQSTTVYYKSGRWRKSIKSVISPFALTFKPIFEDITDASKLVDDLANAALKAEIRDLHLQVKRLTEITLATQTIQAKMSLDLSNQRLHYETSQLEVIQSLPALDHVPSHDASLEYCKSMCRRRRNKLPCSLTVRDVHILKAWLTSDTPSILVGEAHGIKTSSRDFAIDLLDLIKSHSYPAIWALPGTSWLEKSPALEDILASLVMQVLELNPGVLSEGMHPITIKHFRTTRTVDDWLRLLNKSMQGLKFLLVVIDIIMLQNCLVVDGTLAPEELLGRLLESATATGGTIKIAALTWKLDAAILKNSEDSLEAHWIATDPGIRKIRLMRQPKYRMAFQARRQKIAQEVRDGLRARVVPTDPDDI